MIFRQLFDQESCTYTYLVAEPIEQRAFIVDPVASQAPRDLQLITELGLRLEYIIDTHVHADHCTGAHILSTALGAPTVLSAAAGVQQVDRTLAHGERLSLGNLELEARHTPGHTPGCLTLVLTGGPMMMAFTGDALLIRGCGRTDFPQGDARTLYQSVRQSILALPGDTRLYPGHDYKGRPVTTVAEERAYNARLREGIDEDAFVAIMDSLALPLPRLMHIAVPWNMTGGRGGPVTVDGVGEEAQDVSDASGSPPGLCLSHDCVPARQVMTQDVLAVRPTTPILTVSSLLSEHRIRHMPVVDLGGRLKGLLTKRDIIALNHSASSTNIEGEQLACHIMTRALTTASPSDCMHMIGKRMRDLKHGCCPILSEDGVLRGIITESDFIRLITRKHQCAQPEDDESALAESKR